MLKSLKRVSVIVGVLALFALFLMPAVNPVANAAPATETQIVTQAETETPSTETQTDNSKGSKAVAAGICVGLAAALGALAMGIAIAKSNEAIARQPEATSQIKSGLMLGLVFIETAIIYALIVAILVIFVL